MWAGIRTIFQVSISFNPPTVMFVHNLALLQVSLNHYATLEDLEQAMEAITTTLMKCEFYHGLYDKFASQGTGNALAHHKIFDTFKSTFPELYADVIVVAFKARDYFSPRNGISK